MEYMESKMQEHLEAGAMTNSACDHWWSNVKARFTLEAVYI